jgi:hypothetical protein
MKHILLTAAVVVICLAALAAPALAQSGNTWTINYYNNTDWAGYPVMTQYSPYISFNWGYGSPSPAVPADNFTARMTTDAFFYAGTYQFSAVADDEIAVLVDGITYLDTRGKGQSGKSFVFNVPMTWQGNHRVEVLYREFTVSAYVYLSWLYLNSGAQPTPPPTTSPYPPVPPSAKSVVTKFGDYTPCLQQNIHQANCFVSDGAWDSPNLGSIQMEAQITSWNTCVADTTEMYTNPQGQPQSYNCSKTLAGWFPN